MKKRVLCMILVICMLFGCNTSMAATKSKKQVEQQISVLKKEIKKLQASYNQKIKGADLITLGTVANRNPYIVKSPSLFGGNTYYWVTNTNEACDLFGYFYGYLKPTGKYRTANVEYQTVTCVEAKYISTSKESKPLTAKEKKLESLQHTIQDSVILSGMTLGVGESDTINYSWNYSGKDNKITWSSSDDKIATISKTGKVVAKKPGNVKITATASLSGKKSSCTVKVIIKASDLLLDHSEETLKLGDKLQLTASLKPVDAVGTIKFKTSDDYVATVSSKGVVKAVGIGKATITAYTSSGLRAKCTIYVNNPVTKLSFYKDTITFGGYDYTELHVNASPEEYSDTFTVTSDNMNVIEPNDLIEESDRYGDFLIDLKVKGVGTATVTIESKSGVKATCIITVISLSTADVNDDEYAASWYIDTDTENINNNSNTDDTDYYNDNDSIEDERYSDDWY